MHGGRQAGRGQGLGRRVAGRTASVALVVAALLALVTLVPPVARAQTVSVVVEQVIAGGGGGLVSATLDPARRYSLQVLSLPDGATFQGTYSQNWFARESPPLWFLRDGSRRAGSSETPVRGRAPWEHELTPPATGLTQWTLAAGLWSDSGATLIVRILDHGIR
jgi:hypothetical protein